MKEYHRLKFKTLNSQYHLNCFKQLGKKIKVNSIFESENATMSNPKLFWKYVNTRKNSTDVPVSMLNSNGDRFEESYFQFLYSPKTGFASPTVTTSTTITNVLITVEYFTIDDVV